MEIPCRILQFAVASSGVKALLSFTHVNARWRNAALSDPSLWTTIHIKQTTAPLLDVILAHAGNQLFIVYVHQRDHNRLPMLWKLVDRIKELRYFDCPRKLAPFLFSLGPAPNLKVLYLRPTLTIEEPKPLISLPVIFSGCLPSLRHLDPSNMVTWPAGLFRRFSSFKCGILDHFLSSGCVWSRGFPELRPTHEQERWGCYNGPL